MFKLHEMLEKDCFQIAENELNMLLLMNDSNFPWFILVPKREFVTEVFHLDRNDYTELQEQSLFLTGELHQIFKADKMNIASLGNMCPQLHIHHIVRYKTDYAWPSPIWGKIKAKEYSIDEVNRLLEKVIPRLKSVFNFKQEKNEF